MPRALRKWIDRYLAEDEALILVGLLVLALTLIATLGNVLAPVLAAVVLAFMMQGVVARLRWIGVPEPAAVGLAYALFIGVFLTFFLVLLPLVWDQLRGLAADLPRMIDTGYRNFVRLRDEYSLLLGEEQLRVLLEGGSADLASYGQRVLSWSLGVLPGVLGMAIYVVIVPILVFFLLKDRRMILAWCASLLPEDRQRITYIWQEMVVQLANYVRGKGVEILIVGAVSIVTFSLFGLRYALLLGFLVGLSVVIPYVGAVLVTIPVALVAWFQWGWSPMTGYLLLAYLIIQGIDGNVLVPILFSEANNLHPVAIILAVLVFGSIWGVWGAFFAIPLATLVKALMTAWPRSHASRPALDTDGEHD